MNILTDEEIESCSNFSHNRYRFARAIEAAVLSKLAEQDVEPVGYAVMTPFGNAYKFANTLGSAERKREALISKFPDKKQGCISKLYTETQLLAAQQRTAEACAKVCRGEGIGFADDDEELNRIAAMLDAGKWREYL